MIQKIIKSHVWDGGDAAQVPNAARPRGDGLACVGEAFPGQRRTAARDSASLESDVGVVTGRLAEER